jgi:hypothetical protein
MTAFKSKTSALLLFSCFWLLIVLLSGSLFSGYKFMDDSGHIFIKEQVASGNGYVKVLSDYITADLAQRFRVLWSAEYVVRTFLMGDNFVLLSLHRAIESAFICFFLFLFARKIRFSYWFSVLFALLVTVGQQSVIAWSLAASEGIGTFFLALSLLFMAKSVIDKENRQLNNALFILFTVLMSLSKESYIFFVPAVYIWKLWLYSSENKTGFWQTVKENFFTGTILAICALCELYVLISISTNFGYAGTDSGLKLSGYLKTFAFLLVFSLTGLVSLAGMAMIILKKQWQAKEWLYPALLFAAIVLPQAVIYTKSGIMERYFLPGVIGFVMLVSFQFRILARDINHYRISRVMMLAVSLVSAVLCVGGLVLFFSEPLRISLIDMMRGFRGEVVNSMNPADAVIKRSSDNIKMIGAGVGLIGLIMLLAVTVVMYWIKAVTYQLKNVFVAMLVLALLLNAAATYAWAAKFARSGKQTNTFLSTVITRTQRNDAILVVADPWVFYEASSVGITTFLKYSGHRTNLWGFPVFIDPAYNTPANRKIMIPDYYPELTDPVAKQFHCIAVFPGTEQLFLEQASWFKAADYKREELPGGYIVYVALPG